MREDVVILYPIQQPRETPERIRLDGVQHGGREQPGVEGLGVGVYVRGEKDLEEGRREVVDALHVAACRMSDCPHIEDALEALLAGTCQREWCRVQ